MGKADESIGVAFKGWTQEGPDTIHTIVMWVRVPPETAFAYVADMTRHNEWAIDEIEVTPLTPGPVGLGSKYRAVGHQGGKAWPSQLEVTVYEPPHRFEFTATGGPIDTPEGDPHRHTFIFTPQNGGTELKARRSDPEPPNWPHVLWIILVPLVMFYARGHRIRTLERLQAQLDKLADPQSPSIA